MILSSENCYFKKKNTNFNKKMMESVGHVAVPLRVGGKKNLRKRKELDALVAHSLAKRYVIISRFKKIKYTYTDCFVELVMLV